MNLVVEETCFKNSINFFIKMAMEELDGFYSKKELILAKERIYKNIDRLYKENKEYDVFEEKLKNYIDSVDSAIYEFEREVQYV